MALCHNPSEGKLTVTIKSAEGLKAVSKAGKISTPHVPCILADFTYLPRKKDREEETAVYFHYCLCMCCYCCCLLCCCYYYCCFSCLATVFIFCVLLLLLSWIVKDLFL